MKGRWKKSVFEQKTDTFVNMVKAEAINSQKTVVLSVTKKQ